MGDSLAPLNFQQKEFVRQLPLNNFNATAAAKAAGYAASGARSTATRLMSRPDIKAEVERLHNDRCAKYNVTADRVLEEMATAAFLDPLDFYDEDGNLLALKDMPEHARRAINQITETTLGVNVTKREIKVVPKQAALRMLGEYHKLFTQRLEGGLDVSVSINADYTGNADEAD